MEIKVPNLTPLAEAIDALSIKAQHFFIVGLILALASLVRSPSSIGLGIAAGAALLSAAWLQSITLKAFLKQAQGVSSTTTSSSTVTPQPVTSANSTESVHTTADPLPAEPIDLEPLPPSQT